MWVTVVGSVGFAEGVTRKGDGWLLKTSGGASLIRPALNAELIALDADVAWASGLFHC